MKGRENFSLSSHSEDRLELSNRNKVNSYFKMAVTSRAHSLNHLLMHSYSNKNSLYKRTICSGRNNYCWKYSKLILLPMECCYSGLRKPTAPLVTSIVNIRYRYKWPNHSYRHTVSNQT